ncbi:MAG: HAD hydrolase-like protein [Clostridiaceae bacterium]|nr:HAD hydrolase-like protein [Clostridiaceae bacterium]
MRYNLCLFDLDGTLTDPKLGLTRSFQYALSAFGIHEELERLIKFIGPPLRKSFKGDYGFSDEDTEKAVAKHREYFSVTGLYENAIIPGISEILKKLKNNGCILAVVTNKPAYYANKILKHFNLDGYFTLVCGDDMDGNLTINGKCDLINTARDKLDPERNLSVVMIGDRQDDVIGALNAEIDSVGVLWGYGTVEELEAANATKIVYTVNELYLWLIGEAQ